jgi:hypothetical protein
VDRADEPPFTGCRLLTAPSEAAETEIGFDVPEGWLGREPPFGVPGLAVLASQTLEHLFADSSWVGTALAANVSQVASPRFGHAHLDCRLLEGDLPLRMAVQDLVALGDAGIVGIGDPVGGRQGAMRISASASMVALGTLQ